MTDQTKLEQLADEIESNTDSGGIILYEAESAAVVSAIRRLAAQQPSEGACAAQSELIADFSGISVYRNKDDMGLFFSRSNEGAVAVRVSFNVAAELSRALATAPQAQESGSEPRRPINNGPPHRRLHDDDTYRKTPPPIPDAPRENIIDSRGRIRPMPDRQLVAQAVLAVLQNPKGMETLDWEIADAILALSKPQDGGAGR